MMLNANGISGKADDKLHNLLYNELFSELASIYLEVNFC